MKSMFVWIYLLFSLHYSNIVSLLSNTFIFSGSPNTYIAFDPWRPCLTGYIRFDLRTTLADGTVAYIDDRGKFDFFYLKILHGKLRLLFNLGNDRQALNVNRAVNDDRWHTILIKRHGQLTSLILDHGLVENSTLTYSEDLHFGGATHQEYESSPFYFGGIPAIFERPSSGNLSSFDVYMQPRFRGQIRNIVYRNCTDSHLTQPEIREISGGISLIPNSNCSTALCGDGICLINENATSTCLCDESDYQGEKCQSKRPRNELTFFGREYLKYPFPEQNLLSSTEILTFYFQTNHYDGLLFQLIDSQFYIKFKAGQLVVEYRWNSSWYEMSTPKEVFLIDNQWHFVQIQRHHGQIAILIDHIYSQVVDNDVRFDQTLAFNEIFIGGNSDSNLPKFYGCLKDISLMFNENSTIHFNQSLKNFQSHGFFHNKTCQSLIDPIQFLTSFSYLTVDLGNLSREMTNLSFRFETYSSDAILFYSQSLNQEQFLGVDLFDGFLYLTINMNKKKQRKELFQQRFNDGRTHFFQLDIRAIPTGFELGIQVDHRQTTKILLRNSPAKITLQTLTIAGINPHVRWLPTNFYSGLMHRGLVGCFSDLEINRQQINLTEYLHVSNLNRSSRIGPCSTQLSTKRPCLCEHNGECRFNHAGLWTCDCSKTGYTGQRCEQLAYHLDLNEIQLFELNTNIQWSEQINQISFNLHAVHDEENFLQIRSCRSLLQCDSIDFSIRNGLLHLNFYLINLTIEYPFLLDNQWHSIHLQRRNTSFLLHIDNHIIQQRVQIQSWNSSLQSTIWIIFRGNKQILIEDLRLYDQLIYSKLSRSQLKTRPWKPSNTIAFDHHENAYLEIQLNEILCQDCHLNAFSFLFRTVDPNGLLFFAKIQTKLNSSSEYLIIKFVNGYLHFVILNQSFYQTHQIESSSPLNDHDWHQFSFYRTSDYHLQISIDSTEYYLFTSIYFLEKISFGRPMSTPLPPSLSTVKTCLASLTINSHSINFREYIKPNLRLRNDCPLDSQCPLRYCLNTGQCYDRMQCNCEHTSFQGKFCQIFKVGYRFNSSHPGLIFDQPFDKERLLSNYRLSFGLITKMNLSDLIRINDQIWIEVHSGRIRVRLIGNDWFSHPRLINDGFYHLIQIEYHLQGLLALTVDNQRLVQEMNKKLLFDKPFLLLIGQNPIFKHPFQGELYGLQSDIYSVFDLISPTFQRISYTLKTANQTIFSSPLPLIYPAMELDNHTCSYQSYDELCLITSEANLNLLSYTNFTFQSHTIPRLPTKKIFNSTISYQEIYFHPINTTNNLHLPSIHSPTTSTFLRKYSWQYFVILFLLIFFGMLFCLILMICCYMKYRRKDAGVYELVETQRFRPLTIQLPTTGDKQLEANPVSCNKKRRKRRKSPLIEADEQREFYI